jgi:hypothetical protein
MAMALTAVEREELIQRYADGVPRLRAALQRVPTAALQWRPAPNKWSVHEVICHCADSETNAAMRIRFVLAEKSPTIMGYDQDVWAEKLDYHSHPLPAALAAVEAARAHTLPLLLRLDEGAWARAGTHTEMGRYSADDWLRIYAEHLEVHSRQIERNLAAWNSRPA